MFLPSFLDDILWPHSTNRSPTRTGYRVGIGSFMQNTRVRCMESSCHPVFPLPTLHSTSHSTLLFPRGDPGLSPRPTPDRGLGFARDTTPFHRLCLSQLCSSEEADGDGEDPKEATCE